MKHFNRNRLFVAIAVAGSLLLSSCEGGTEEPSITYHTSVPGGGKAYRANTVQFHYVDAAGRSLIDPSDAATWPLPCSSTDRRPDHTQITIDQYTNYYYYRQDNGWSYSSEIRTDEAGRPYYATIFPVDQSTDRITYYLYHRGSFDRIDLTYSYTNDAFGGDGWYAHVLSLKINGQHLYSDREAGHHTGPYRIILRKSDNRTDLRVE